LADVLFYQRPVVLNRQAHRTLKVKSTKPDFSFARQTNSVPIAGVEFARAALEYPIVFAGPSPDKLLPAVLLGLRENENLFVDPEGQWANAYVPAFIRRYPFVLAEKPGGGDFTVCIDSTFKGLGVDEGQSLFDDEGKETPLLKGVMDFLGQYQGNIRRTQVFTKRLSELNLLHDRALRIPGADGSPLVLRGFQAVDENILNKLSDAEISDLYRQGFLGWILAHLISLGNAYKLQARIKKTSGETVTPPG
jgi:SapC